MSQGGAVEAADALPMWQVSGARALPRSSPGGPRNDVREVC